MLRMIPEAISPQSLLIWLHPRPDLSGRKREIAICPQQKRRAATEIAALRAALFEIGADQGLTPY
jgi:hypothetical protein